MRLDSHVVWHRRWFGLILLPFVSFSADGTVAVVFFLESVYDQITGKKIQTPSMLARGRAIDLSIQFTLWWMPFLVLLGWWSTRPMHLLFGGSPATISLAVPHLRVLTEHVQTSSRWRCSSGRASW